METSTTKGQPVEAHGLHIKPNPEDPAMDHRGVNPMDVTSQYTAVFHAQENAVTQYFEHSHPNQLLFYISSKKSQFIETKKLQVAKYLNMRDNVGLMQLQHLFNNLHIVDDLVMSISHHLPPQRPIGWQLVSQSKNLMNLPTVGLMPSSADFRGLEHSLAATVIQFLGVACYHNDRGYFVGHILGYLFSCYYFAHLGVNYSVTPLKEAAIPNYPYQVINVAELVRLLQSLDESLKAQVYQLAIYCAQISEYAVDKRIEKMLITEVNSFNKQDLRDELSVLVQYDSNENESLFQPIKPLK